MKHRTPFFVWDDAFSDTQPQAKILLRTIEQFGNEQILLCNLPWRHWVLGPENDAFDLRPSIYFYWQRVMGDDDNLGIFWMPNFNANEARGCQDSGFLCGSCLRVDVEIAWYGMVWP